MRTSLVLAAGLFIAAAASAHNCPNEMKAIDARLAAKPALSADAAAQVQRLRASGEAHHKAGRHTESMQDLGQAKKLLGI